MTAEMPTAAGSSQETGTTDSTPPKRSGHRHTNVRDAVAEMAARAQEISQEAGSRIGQAMKDVINAGAGLATFAVESARDLVQYMVRRGQMTQEEADKLMREVESAGGKRPARAAGTNGGSTHGASHAAPRAAPRAASHTASHAPPAAQTSSSSSTAKAAKAPPRTTGSASSASKKKRRASKPAPRKSGASARKSGAKASGKSAPKKGASVRKSSSKRSSSSASRSKKKK